MKLNGIAFKNVNTKSTSWHLNTMLFLCDYLNEDSLMPTVWENDRKGYLFPYILLKIYCFELKAEFNQI